MNTNTGIIYKIVNLVNGKVYIGQTKSPIHKRKGQHFRELEQGVHGNPRLQNSYNKYGKDNFELTVLKTGIAIEDLDAQEAEFMEKYQSLDKKIGFNILPVRIKGQFKIPEEVQQKIAATKKKKVEDGWVSPLKGRPQTEENRRKLSEARKAWLSTLAVNPKAIPVVCSDGREWPSIKAAARAINLTPGNLSRNISQGMKSRGLVFRYKHNDDRDFIGRSSNPQRKPIIACDGRRWVSMEEAAKDMGTDRSYVSRRIRAGKPCKGVMLRVDYGENSGTV